MKKFFYLSVLLMATFGLSSCGDDEETPTSYEISVLSPDNSDKKVGDEISISVNFEEANDKTVHHVKVTIYDKDDNTNIIYSGPNDAHVHDESGKFEYSDNFTLDVDAHSDWILEAKVWGHEAGAAEVTQTVPFHVHPQ